jgi:transcriptional regulator with XRE-family HTH domain
MQTVIRTMVEKITVATDNSGARPRARITIHYRFNADTPTDFTRTVPRTDKHADNCVGIVTTTAEYPPAPEPGTTPRERLIYLQYQHNILQPELASIAGASSATISNMVNGHNETMRPHVIKKICDHYGLPYSFLGAYDQLPEDTTADKLRKGRLYRLLRQPDAAAYFGVDTRTYNKWEHGRISNNPRAAQIDARKFAEWVSIFRE